jgi:hypothetical protein
MFTKFHALTLINPSSRHRIKREVGTDYAGGRHRLEGILHAMLSLVYMNHAVDQNHYFYLQH